ISGFRTLTWINSCGIMFKLLLCATSVFSVSLWLPLTTETQRTQRLHREDILTRRQIFHCDAHSLHRDLPFRAAPQYFLDTLLGHLQAGNDHFINFMLHADRTQITISSKNAQSVNHFSTLRRIIVDKTDRREM